MQKSRLEKSKKGQVGRISTSVIALGVAAIILVIFLVIIQEMRDVDVISAANSANTENETISTVDEVGEDLAVIASQCKPVCTITYVTNASTGGEIIDSGNWTESNNGCTITAVDPSEYNSSDWNVTYTNTYGDTACEQANNTIVGLGSFADYWTIIVLAIVAGIVIAIIFGAFGGFSRKR